MKTTLFDVLGGIIDSGFTLIFSEKVLSKSEHVIAYAEGCGVDVNNDQAESIIRVGRHWLNQIENGNGEWSRMREEAKAAMTCYMQIVSGDVATAEMWKNDFDAMDVESWFGKSAEECEGLHWLNDMPSLIEVVFDTELQEWVEA